MITIQNLNFHPKVIVTTDLKEQFEIIPKEDEYIIKANTHPTTLIKANEIYSMKTVKQNNQTEDTTDRLFYKGITKGYRFAWIKAGCSALNTTKGMIESCATVIELGGVQFRLQMLETLGEMFEWSGLNRSFTVKTDKESFVFDARGTDYYFKGNKVINIMSLYRSHTFTETDMLNHDNEYDAITGTIFYNHPFILFTEVNDSLHMQVCSKVVTTCQVH